MTTTVPEPETAAAPESDDSPRRVLLKLSGEAFGGGNVGVDPDVVKGIAHQIADAHRSGAEIAVVIGGGNFFRGAELQQRGMERARADYMGMLGTVMNCLALRTSSSRRGCRRGSRPPSTWGRSRSRTSHCARNDTWRRDAS